MPGYRFTTCDGKKVDRDDEPRPFRNDGAAFDAAQEALVKMANDALPHGKSVDLTTAIDNDEGERIYEASLTFRGKTADDIKADEAREEADADSAIEAVIQALNDMGRRIHRQSPSAW